MKWHDAMADLPPMEPIVSGSLVSKSDRVLGYSVVSGILSVAKAYKSGSHHWWVALHFGELALADVTHWCAIADLSLPDCRREPWEQEDS